MYTINDTITNNKIVGEIPPEIIKQKELKEIFYKYPSVFYYAPMRYGKLKPLKKNKALSKFYTRPDCVICNIKYSVDMQSGKSSFVVILGDASSLYANSVKLSPYCN